MGEEERKKILKKHIDESERTIDYLKHQHTIELEKVRQSYDAKLNEMKAELMKNLEEANIEARNMANETISKLNKQVIQERGKILAEQQENSKQLQEEFRLKNEQLNQSLRDIEERELSWQEERQDVLNEVQRLKADATRMAKLLAMEYEDDNCLGNKRRSLSQEVYSLQLVVEMRTGEVRSLREQMAKATQQLEQAENWPQAPLNRNPLSKIFGRHMLFFKCADKAERKMCAKAQMLKWLETIYGTDPSMDPSEHGLPKDKYDAAAISIMVLNNAATPEEEFVGEFFWGMGH